MPVAPAEGFGPGRSEDLPATALETGIHAQGAVECTTRSLLVARSLFCKGSSPIPSSHRPVGSGLKTGYLLVTRAARDFAEAPRTQAQMEISQVAA